MNNARTTDALLYLNGVTVSFDGFRALNELSLIVERGELRTIIGPNGAGKTTFFNLLSGFFRPSAGKITFAGRDITAKPAHQRVRGAEMWLLDEQRHDSPERRLEQAARQAVQRDEAD